jgi:hypothetical protein
MKIIILSLVLWFVGTIDAGRVLGPCEAQTLTGFTVPGDGELDSNPQRQGRQKVSNMEVSRDRLRLSSERRCPGKGGTQFLPCRVQ